MHRIGLTIAAVAVGFGLSLAIVGCSSPSAAPKDKMATDKMATDKMATDKMATDKMSGDKMEKK